LDLSSAIFCKGTFYGYVKAKHKNSISTLSTSSNRSKMYSGFKGALLQCAQYIFEKENEIEHRIKK